MGPTQPLQVHVHWMDGQNLAATVGAQVLMVQPFIDTLRNPHKTTTWVSASSIHQALATRWMVLLPHTHLGMEMVGAHQALHPLARLELLKANGAALCFDTTTATRGAVTGSRGHAVRHLLHHGAWWSLSCRRSLEQSTHTEQHGQHQSYTPTAVCFALVAATYRSRCRFCWRFIKP